MASLQILPLCFLLATTKGSNFHDLKCEEDVTAEIGGTVNITCQNNEAMVKAAVTFCRNESKTSCPDASDLSTIKNIYTTDDGRISMTMINQSVILNVHKVQISDQRCYKVFLEACNGYVDKFIYLKVVAPYSKPQTKIQKDTVVCTASGGHPQRQLYWFDDHGTNLTHNSKLVSLKNEDGSFSLISTLQLQSLDSGTICCSILNNNTNCDPPQGSGCVCVGKETTTNKVSQDAGNKILIPVLIVVTLAAICAVTVFCCRKKKGGIKNPYLQRLFLSKGTSVTNQIEANAVTESRNTWETVTLQDSAIQIVKARDSV